MTIDRDVLREIVRAQCEAQGLALEFDEEAVRAIGRLVRGPQKQNAAARTAASVAS